MYVYDDFDRTLVAERVAEFRDQVARRLSGELTEDEFKPLRLMNGVYLQLHAYMLRIAIPYGTLSSAQLRMLAHVARRYDRGYGHFTTRQNIQFHWIKLEELPDAMADLASVGMHGMQTSGNCVRNLTTDQWAGVAPDEIEDPRIWAEIIRQHVTMHPEFSFLPRKFKIAVTAAAHDRAALRVHDLGAAAASQRRRRDRLRGHGRRRARPHAVPRQDHQAVPAQARRAELRRRRPAHLQPVRPARQSSGRRASRSWSTISAPRNLPGRSKPSGRRSRTARWRSILPTVAEIAARFRYPAYERLDDNPPALAAARKADRGFDAWVDNSVANHKVAGYAIVTLSLKPEGGTPGDCHGRADGRDRRSRRPLFIRRNPRRPRAEPGAAACRAARSAGFVAGARCHRRGDAECRPRLRHHLLPGPRLLQPGEYALHSGGAGNLAALPRPRPRARPRQAAHQHFGLHQCLRPSSRRPHRHSRRREERRGVLPDHDRRPRRRGGAARHIDRACRFLRGSARRGRGHRRRLSRTARAAAGEFHPDRKRTGVEPFKERVYAAR